jgi:hypothetical protein
MDPYFVCFYWSHNYGVVYYRLWLFPVASLAEAETCLSSVKELTVTVEGLEPLVRRGVEATATVPDLEGPSFWFFFI